MTRHDHTRCAADPLTAMLGNRPGGLDIRGRTFASRTSWPIVLIELNLILADLSAGFPAWRNRATDLRDAAFDSPDLMSECLAARQLVRVNHLNAPPDPPAGIAYSVVDHDNPDHCGVFGPNACGTPRGWAVMRPLPPTLEGWWQMVAARDWRVIVAVTSDTNLDNTDDDIAFHAGVADAVELGKVWAAPAVATRRRRTRRGPAGLITRPLPRRHA